MDKKGTIRFDLSADKLLDFAEAKLDAGENVAALRFLHKSLELYGDAPDEYADLADAYEAMELYEQAINCWFRYLDVCEEDEAVDAYEGLAACYYNLGNEPQASHYYTRMLHDKFVTPANNIEMGELFDKPPARPLRIAWPPESADYSAEIDAGLKALKNGEYAAAEEKFSAIHPRSEYRVPALNYLAVCYLLEGKNEQAEGACRELLERAPDNVQALATYAAVLTEQGRTEESRAVAGRLAEISTENADELYKIATVCCENGLYRTAYEHFCKLETMVRYDQTLLYFKAVAAFRCGEVKESCAALGKILDIYPASAVARYYFREIRRFAEEGGTPPETSFFYRVPAAERADRVRFLQALRGLRAAELEAYCRAADVTELLEWCFDEADGQDAELQLLGAAVAARGNVEAFLRALLLDSTVNDIVKVETVRMMCGRNRDFEYGIVLADSYRVAAFNRLEIGRAARKHFVAAYALCFARFALLGEGDGEEYRAAAQALYAALHEAGELRLAADESALACAVYLSVTGAVMKKARGALRMLEADAGSVASILGAVRRARASAEAAAADASESAPEEDSGGETAAESDSARESAAEQPPEEKTGEDISGQGNTPERDAQGRADGHGEDDDETD